MGSGQVSARQAKIKKRREWEEQGLCTRCGSGREDKEFKQCRKCRIYRQSRREYEKRNSYPTH